MLDPLRIVDSSELDEITLSDMLSTTPDPMIRLAVRNESEEMVGLAMTRKVERNAEYILTEDEARQLFNWLGIWLHRR